ncbi:GNAT family protein [Fodinibacter luteus]|uniref:GNAT family protein n=1 Tax=Fodinibacter luteus TaxID=552064 RepID=A0ABP8JWJ6_9MICO
MRLVGRTPLGTEVTLRPLRLEDGPAFASVRRANAAWLEPWDATSPDPDAPARGFAELVAQYDADARAGRALPFAVEVDGRLVGQLSVGSIVLGSFRSCFVGYWVSRSVAGRMVIPTALALAGDHVVGTLGLHRVEVNIRPENTASLAVVRKLGFREEGLRPHYLHIAGEWRDHVSFALTTEDLAGETFMERLARLAGDPATGPGTHATQSSQQSLARHTEGGPAPGGGAHLPF